MRIRTGLFRKGVLVAAAALPLLLAARGAVALVEDAIAGGPTDERAKKTFAGAGDWQKKGQTELAIDSYRRANKQDGGNCAECLRRAYNLAMEINDFKSAIGVVQEWLPTARSDSDRATLHFWQGMALQRQGIAEKKDKCFNQSCDEFKAALSIDSTLASVHYGYGMSLAYLKQDDAARSEFNNFLASDKENASLHERARRFVERIDLARARMAPAFTVTTIDGQHISMDSLAGRVVLIDFWATWCGPCRESLPHLRKVVQQFQGQPFVALSVSLDSDEGKWKDFVGKNGMTWLQYRDGGFAGVISRKFNVDAIPATFSIDADGVLEDQHVGDADIEGKLKKMIARAIELEQKKQVTPVQATQSSGN
jgi:thiol-disulfide isomerase/thioredoxin